LDWEDIFAPRLPSGQSLHYQIDCPKPKQTSESIPKETKTFALKNK